MEQPDKETIDRWHRWFAIECNNRAWDLTSAGSRTPEEDREMLSAAYAAAFHWSKVGKPINAMRADSLLATAHAHLGHGPIALGYARQCLEFCEKNECSDWDLAFAHVQMALAASVARDSALHASHHARARELGAALENEEERKIFADEFSRVPTPA